jgi:RNA polymerase sigma-70 factor (ECF subfamily)
LLKDYLVGKWDHLRPWDNQVLTALSAGDVQRAMDALVRGYQDVVVGYCVHMLGDPIQGEDVAQEVFLAAYQALPRFRGDALVRTFVFAIARHQCWKHMSKERRWKKLLKAAGVDPLEPPDERRREAERAALEERQLERLPQSLRQLPPLEKTLLMLRYYEDLSFAAIAKQFHEAETNIRRWMQKAEAQLKRTMAEEIVDYDT